MAANRIKENKDFIAMIHDHPALWDHAHHLYSDKAVCDALWEYIGSKFNISSPSAKSRWKNLRDNFRRELRRSAIGLQGTSFEEYQTSWPYFKQIFFIKDQLRQCNIISTLAISKVQNRLDAKETSSSSVLPNGPIDEVEIEETTHDAFVREFPEATYARESRRNGEIDLQKLMATGMKASFDPDVNFLASLIPHIRSVDSKKKAWLKKKMMQEVFQYCQNDINDNVINHEGSGLCSNSEEVDGSYESSKSTSVNKNKRKLIVLRNTDAKKKALENSVVLEV